MINFCHIFPTPHLDLSRLNGSHLLLAHLIETDEQYRSFYKNLDDQKYKIMDNGAFEKFKAGEEMYDADMLLEMANDVSADCIVLPDYPMEEAIKTIEAAMEWIPSFKSHGFDTFFVPQSERGDTEGYIESIKWALDNPEVGIIGLSILGCPIALGLEEQTYDKVSEVDSAYKMQRFLSRWKILQLLEQRGLLNDKAIGRFHCLGMVDGPNEIDLLHPYRAYIRSWDSSSAPWLGLYGGQTYDQSPTGIRNGKFESEVEFDYHTDKVENVEAALYNIEFINSKLGVSNPS